MVVAYTSEPFTYPGGGVAAGVPVAVYFSGTLVRAAIFHDAAGAVLKANPVKTDNAGVVSFYAEPGDYELWANGEMTPITITGPVDPPGPDDFVTLAQAQALDAAVLASANVYTDNALAGIGGDPPGPWTAPDVSGTLWAGDLSGVYFPAGFRLDRGVVNGRGRLVLQAPNSYVANSRICTLPEDCRPERDVIMQFRTGNTNATGSFMRIEGLTGIMSFSAGLTNATGFAFLQLEMLQFPKVV